MTEHQVASVWTRLSLYRTTSAAKALAPSLGTQGRGFRAYGVGCQPSECRTARCRRGLPTRGGRLRVAAIPSCRRQANLPNRRAPSVRRRSMAPGLTCLTCTELRSFAAGEPLGTTLKPRSSVWLHDRRVTRAGVAFIEARMRAASRIDEVLCRDRSSRGGMLLISTAGTMWQPPPTEGLPRRCYVTSLMSARDVNGA